MYYLSKNTDKIFTKEQLNIVDDIYGEDEFKSCLEIKMFVPVEAPSVIDLVNCKNMPAAAHRYKELHNCTLKEAYDAVYNIKRDIYRFNKKSSRREEK